MPTQDAFNRCICMCVEAPLFHSFVFAYLKNVLECPSRRYDKNKPIKTSKTTTKTTNYCKCQSNLFIKQNYWIALNEFKEKNTFGPKMEIGEMKSFTKLSWYHLRTEFYILNKIPTTNEMHRNKNLRWYTYERALCELALEFGAQFSDLNLNVFFFAL